LIITLEKSILVVSRLDYYRALKEAKADEIINLKDYDNNLQKLLKEKVKNYKKLGVIEDFFPYSLSSKLRGKKLIDISRITYELRSIKTKNEINLIKKSCSIATKGLKIIEREINPKTTEKELYISLFSYLLKMGAEDLAFPTIVTSGCRSSSVHPEPSFSNKKIGRGIGLIDFGVIYKGYCSDITVPFTIGQLNERERKIVNSVNDVYESVVESLDLEKPAWKIFEIYENFLSERGFEVKHSLGHGIGLDVHEFPNLSPKPKNKNQLKKWEETKLKEGMIFTIEPGIYVDGLGGCRLENDFLMTSNGIKILSKSKFIEL